MSRMMANILVIDDEVGMREGCRRALTPQGFQVDVAEHGVEGLRKLREGHYDLILLDAMMPGMSGLELLERIQEHDPSIICIMITGYATVDLAAQAMKHGAHDFLPKPFTADELLTVVDRGLAERQRQLAQQKQRESEEEALQLRRTRQEIAKLEAIESRFMLIIVHELRNPAGVIKNYVQLMRAGYVDGEEWDEYLAKLDVRAGQLLRMLDDLLELAHLKGMLKPLAVAKGLALEREIQARPTILAQPAHLESLWTNLIENAIGYTRSGWVSVTLDEQNDEMVTVVSDTGIGISTEEVTRIFQDFYRSETAKAEVEHGTGLGLPIVNQIVKIYQGTIRVDSTPGQGSSFTVTLPLAVSDVDM
jgi:two-component system sensor histidine kinase/response regulator